MGWNEKSVKPKEVEVFNIGKKSEWLYFRKSDTLNDIKRAVLKHFPSYDFFIYNDVRYHRVNPNSKKSNTMNSPQWKSKYADQEATLGTLKDQYKTIKIRPNKTFKSSPKYLGFEIWGHEKETEIWSEIKKPETKNKLIDFYLRHEPKATPIYYDDDNYKKENKATKSREDIPYIDRIPYYQDKELEELNIDNAMSVLVPSGVDRKLLTELYSSDKKPYLQKHRKDLLKVSNDDINRLADKKLTYDEALLLYELAHVAPHGSDVGAKWSLFGKDKPMQKQNLKMLKALNLPTDLDTLYVNRYTGGSYSTLSEILGKTVWYRDIVEHYPVAQIQSEIDKWEAVIKAIDKIAKQEEWYNKGKLKKKYDVSYSEDKDISRVQSYLRQKRSAQENLDILRKYESVKNHRISKKPILKKIEVAVDDLLELYPMMIGTPTIHKIEQALKELGGLYRMYFYEGYE
jgi:hypothetical protein